MYLFEVKYLVEGQTKRNKKGIEVDEIYDLGEAWHVAIEESIEASANNERIDSIQLIAL